MSHHPHSVRHSQNDSLGMTRERTVTSVELCELFHQQPVGGGGGRVQRPTWDRRGTERPRVRPTPIGTEETPHEWVDTWATKGVPTSCAWRTARCRPPWGVWVAARTAVTTRHPGRSTPGRPSRLTPSPTGACTCPVSCRRGTSPPVGALVTAKRPLSSRVCGR